MDIEGKIIMDLPMQTGTSKAGNPWKKKEWVLETFGQYPRKVKFHIFGDRADTLTFEVGRDYVVSVDIESREFNGKWYTDVNAYAAHPREMGSPQTGGGWQQPMGQPMQQPMGQPMQPAAPQQPFGAQPADPQFTPGNDAEDLPF